MGLFNSAINASAIFTEHLAREDGTQSKAVSARRRSMARVATYALTERPVVLLDVSVVVDEGHAGAWGFVVILVMVIW